MEDIETLTRKSLAALDVKRKALESEAEVITLELTAPIDGDGPPMGIDTPLVDSDGYPRADIDIYRARSLRGRLAEIRTDHKLLMRQIEETLHQLAAMKDPRKEEEVKEEMAARTAEKPKPKFDPISKKWVVMNWDGSVAGIEQGEHLSFDEVGQEVNSAQLRNMNVAVGPGRDTTTSEFTTPFAKVDSVAAHSPAESAGMKEGDLIVKFGNINYTNHRQLQAIAELVPEAASDQQGIMIKALRKKEQSEGPDEDQIVSINLIPKPWNGRGLIGCHIVPHIG